MVAAPVPLALIPLFPLVGFLANALLGRRLTKGLSGGIACLAMLGAFAASVAAVWHLVSLPVERRIVEDVVYTWITSGDFDLPFTLRLDPLGAVMVLVVSGIGLLIHVYSTAYMHEETDAEYARYFSYLNLFAFFMLVLVLGANFLVMFVGWEGVGLCSYLLIGFWFRRKSASDAGKKAFVVNRIGDFAFILGMLLAFREFGTLDFLAINERAATLAPEVGFGLLTLMTLLFFIGATGKSAQIPLYVWLPDAMEGPTPVSALIHAATMVTAGVYMIGRNAELFGLAPLTLQTVAVVGAATALLAGTIGLAQNDIKRVLAYSTVSQLGYMFLAMGVGAFAAGIFHLYTHAFFKALLFLGSGAVIHALHGEQDMQRMGGLRPHLPLTYWTFLIGTLAIVGVPGLAGFFSKDEILFYTFYKGHHVLWAMAAVTALLTATYMFRLVYLTFHGTPRFATPPHGPGASASGPHGPLSHDHGPGAGARVPGSPHLHDAPPAMAIVLVLLALGSVVAGYVGVPHALGGSNRIGTFLEPSFRPAAFSGPPHAIASDHGTEAAFLAHAEAGRQAGHATDHDPAKLQLERTLMVVSVVIALAGIGLATAIFLQRPERADRLARAWPRVHRLLRDKYYVDELYDAVFVQPIRRGSERLLWRGIDAGVIDGTVNGVGAVVRGWAAMLRLWQSGSVRTYAVTVLAGVLLVIAYYVTR